jgi:Folate-dependent phosphoribosylglycinamide formyltransferase PurN
MKKLGLGILGSGKGSNCRAILEQIAANKLPAEARLVISDVFDAGILDVAREFKVPNIYLPPGSFPNPTRTEGGNGNDSASARGGSGSRRPGGVHARSEGADVERVSSTDHKHPSVAPPKVSRHRGVEAGARSRRKSDRLFRALCGRRDRQWRNNRATNGSAPVRWTRLNLYTPGSRRPSASFIRK